jgi:hypothetical protein
MMITENNWNEIVEKLKVLNEQKIMLEENMKKEYLKNIKQTFTLSKDTRLNWRLICLVVSGSDKNIPVVEVKDWESPRCFNGRNSKDHIAGTCFLVLKEWKTGNTKGTHYLLYDKKTKCVANFYG